MAEENLIRLKKKRTVIRTAVTKILNKLELELLKEDVTSDDLEEMLEQLNDKSVILQSLDSELEVIFATDDLDNELENMLEYREKIVLWKHRTGKKLRALNDTSTVLYSLDDTNRTQPLQNSSGILENVRIKLPKLSISKFFGDISHWLTFWNSFKTAIHDNENLDKINKFNYLKAHLGGTALNTIEGFSTTPENYDSAIQLLEQRFGRKDILINSHMNNIINLHPLKCSTDVRQFRKLFDYCTTQIRSLESLGVASDNFGSLLSPMILKNLPNDLVLEYNKRDSNEVDNYDLNDLMDFLSKALQARERTSCVSKNFGAQQGVLRFEKEKYIKTEKPRFATAAHLLSQTVKENINKVVCIFCGEADHDSTECEFANNLSFEEKRGILLKRGACFKCLKFKHISTNCKAKLYCNLCNGRHLAIMCFSKQSKGEPNKQTKVETYSKNSSKLTDNNVLTNQSQSKEVYLQTLIVRISEKDIEHFIRIIIDTGSQKSYISKFAAETLGLNSLGEETVKHGLFGGIETSVKHKYYWVNISSIDRKQQYKIEVMDQAKICASIPRIQNKQCLDDLENRGIFLTDISLEGHSCLHQENLDEVHMLIGADIAGKLFTGKIECLLSGLVAVHTRLGWTVMGKASSEMLLDSSLMVLSLHVADAKISDLWNLDSLGITDPGESLKRREIQELTLKHFKDTVKQQEDGRYIVALPWLEGHLELPAYKNLAEKRLKNTVKNLKSIDKLKDYEQVFEEWKKEEIIEEVPETEEEKSSGIHYMPHRAVIKENATTKIRPVFYGSAHTQGKVSINDCIEKGPNLIELIPSILNRFRTGRIGIVADIRKAFLQIALREQDRNYLRFLWWKEGESESTVTYRHCRVVFGISCSPFLLAATIARLLEEVPDCLIDLTQKLKGSMYVDNCVSSVNTVEELNYFRKESQKLFATAKFDLRGWRHNTAENLKIESEHDNAAKENERIPEIPVLGLNWNIVEDTLSCNVQEITIEEPVTKRKILSLTHKIFDPIGLTCPITLIPKLLLQECWKTNASWDSKLPEPISKQFEKWASQLPELENLKIPRILSALPLIKANMSIHVFCDACQTSYATCIFLRVEHINEVTCQLIQARSKVAPLKPITIPRLELLACTIGARLANTVKSDLKMEDVETFYWSDSMDVLHWIKRDGMWATFVANRVKEIRSLTNTDKWQFVPGTQNPSDIPSRGCSVKILIKKRWLEGPLWLKDPKEKWPNSELNPNLEVVNMEKKKLIISSVNKVKDDYYCKISSYPKIIRVTAWIFRFYENSKKGKCDRISGEINDEEFRKAERTILKQVQINSFSASKKNLNSLPIVYDSDGLIRIKTKVLLRDDHELFRLPIVLPSDHNVVNSLIIWKHQVTGHSGVQYLMAILRENYWILKSRKTIKKTIKSCTICQRFSAQPPQVLEGILPENRVRNAKIFEIIGVDLAGPLILRNKQKVWILMLTCAVYRAVHFELLSSLSTENFLLALRRFIARRGRPSFIYSDNGTNFVGAHNLLKGIDFEKVKSCTNLSHISWKFIPPSAPWWGGFWERLIGLLKRILRKILGRTSLDYEEMSTVLCDCEGILNSRPLTYVSEDVKDLSPITPAMFLQEIEEIGVPDFDILDKRKLIKRHKYLQKVRQDLRNRFRIEYLGQLRQTSLNGKNSKAIKVGDVVLIWNDNQSRLYWQLGKIVETYPGKDGLTRVAKVKTKSGVLIRPTKKLCPLELDDSSYLITDIDPKPLDHMTSTENQSQNSCTEPASELSDIGDYSVKPVTTRSGRVVRIPLRYPLQTT